MTARTPILARMRQLGWHVCPECRRLFYWRTKKVVKGCSNCRAVRSLREYQDSADWFCGGEGVEFVGTDPISYTGAKL